MHARGKPRYDSQHQTHYPRTHHNYGGVPQQGPPQNVGQNRMPNAAASMRAQGMNVRQHVPQQQQPQQQQQQLQNQQVQQQQAQHGVPVQHHQAYTQVSTQGHHPTQLFYHANPHGGPHNFITMSPFPISVTANPGMPLHQLTQSQSYIPRYYPTTFQPGSNQQHTQAAYYPPTATAHAQQMYAATVAPHYIQQQHRMPTVALHNAGQAVANAQQLQQPVAPTHATVVTGISTAAQHQTQHSHPQQTGVPVVPQQPQQIPRQEQGMNQGKREKKILNIVDPRTGQAVIGQTPGASSENSSSSQSSESSSAKGASTNDSAQIPVPGAADKQDPQSQTSQPAQESQEVKQKEETVASNKDDGGNAAGSDTKTTAAAKRAEFFQKITQASDDTRSSSTASTGSTATNASSNNNTGSSRENAQHSGSETPQPTEPVAVAESTPVPSTPTKEKSPSPEPNKQLVVSTPVANTSSDESKDESLVSISPTPMDHYATPRSKEPISSPPLQATAEKYVEETVEDNEASEDGVVSEEIIEPEVTEPARHNNNDVEEISDSVQESEIRADSELSGSVGKQEDLEKDEDMDVDESEVVEENQPNGHVPLEEGEIEDDDEVEEESSIADVGADSQEDAANTAKGKIKYDREFLLRIGNQNKGINEFKVDLPDLARDLSSNNHIKHQGTPVGKNSPGGRDYRGVRGGIILNKGNPMMGHGMQHNRTMNSMGMGSWGAGGPGPLMVPPPPPHRIPPKVQLTLTREEVKLHKAENAWKPGALKRSSQADQAADEEALAIESIVKKTRGILNKLTPDNFDKLVSKFMELPLEDKDERILSVICVVFEKAIDEPSFSTAYAKMVHTVCKTSQETSKKFRKQILDQCQKEFQKSSADEDVIKEVEQKLAEATDEETRKELKADLEDKKYMSRRRSLGNVRFIGELYKLQMLTPKIMVECVHLLLYAPDEEKLECLCKLLSTVGERLDLQLKHLESSVNRGEKTSKFIPETKWMEKIFHQLKDLSDDKKFSSRIRFAILDVVELRDNGWKPRRDTNAPKTLEEVRKDAIRQELEEKRQINSLPPVQNNTYGGGGDRDHRPGSNSRLPGSQQQKKSEWTTTPKASRFQTGAVKKSDPPSSGMPIFGPPSGTGFGWQRNQSGPSGPSMSKQPPNLPPRLQNRFQNLSMEDNRPSNKSINSSHDSGGYRSERDQPPQQQQQHIPPNMFQSQSHGGPPSLRSTASPPPSINSSAENSRPVSPKEQLECTANTNESVKNIFQEYLASKKFDDTLHWIRKRFRGSKIEEFIEEMSRQVAEMSKEEEQKCAGSLVRLLIRNKEIPKDNVIRIMAQGVMEELPDILIDSPKATTYLAQFLVEIFSEESNLDWLVQVGKGLVNNEYDDGAAWRDLSVNSLNLLKLRNNEENVQTSFKKTENKHVIPVDEIPWLQHRSTDSVAEQMVQVLSPKLNSESSEEIGQLFQEHSWDVREEVTSRALTEAICRLTWNSETGSWEDEKVKKLLPLLALPNPKMFPVVWKQAEEYSRNMSIEKKKLEGLWNIMYSMNMTTTVSTD